MSYDPEKTAPEQEAACRWAHGPVDAADLDERGLCPVCADDGRRCQ
jgi:hypothetical protein